MIRAYDENLLDKAMDTLASMFDYAVNQCKVELVEFYNMFLQSGIADSFAIGESRIVAGKSGIELAREILWPGQYKVDYPPQSFLVDRSEEYWLGYYLAYYQWYRNISFSGITEAIGIDYILKLYNPYHEMDVMHFVERIDEAIAGEKYESKLKRLRTYANLSQSQLASVSGIPLRTIQQYEQGQKNISKASFETVLALAKTLHCSPESIL